MAITLPPDGKVVACDITDKFMKEVQSQSYFKEVSETFRLSNPSSKTVFEIMSWMVMGTFERLVSQIQVVTGHILDQRWNIGEGH